MLCDTKHIVQVVNNMKRHYPRALHSFFISISETVLMAEVVF